MRWAPYKGRYQKFSLKRPRAQAVCQLSGLNVMHDDLRWQMEYGGNGLYNTGLRGYKNFIYKPNPQLMAPPVRADPYPIHLPLPEPAQTVNPQHQAPFSTTQNRVIFN